MKHLVAALALAIVAAGSPAWATRTDVVYLNNGDRITCSVKELTRGKLRVTTDSMGTIFINWVDVRSVETTKTFAVKLQNGRFEYGNLSPAESAGELTVHGDGTSSDLPLHRVVELAEIKRGFFRRIDGSIDFGFNYQQANKDINYSLQAEATHRAKRADTSIWFDSIFSSRNDVPNAYRRVLGLSHVHDITGKWQAAGIGKAEQNEELGLDLRTNLGAAAGRLIIETNKSRLRIMGGLTTNREHYVLEPDALFSLEALITTTYDFFVYGDLGADFAVNLSLYPSLTDSGRYRVEFDGKYRHEIFTDFYVSLSGWYSFDSGAPVAEGETVRQEDYGMVTSLGLSF